MLSLCGDTESSQLLNNLLGRSRSIVCRVGQAHAIVCNFVKNFGGVVDWVRSLEANTVQVEHQGVVDLRQCLRTTSKWGSRVVNVRIKKFTKVGDLHDLFLNRHSLFNCDGFFFTSEDAQQVSLHAHEPSALLINAFGRNGAKCIFNQDETQFRLA